MTELGRPTPQEEIKAAPLEEGRVREENFDSLQAQFDGVRVLVDHDADPDITRRDTIELRQVSNEFAPPAVLVRGLRKPQQLLRDKIERFGRRFPGLRGIRDASSGYEVQINPSRTDVFDEDLLRQSLGIAEPEIVHRTAIISVELNPDEKDAQAVYKSMRRVLRRKGYSIEDVEVMLKVNNYSDVDKEELSRRIKDGKVTLLEGAWERPITGYNIVAWDLKTSDELGEEVARAAKAPKTS